MTAAKLSQWRDEFLAGGEARLKHREEAVEDEDTRRLKSVVADQQWLIERLGFRSPARVRQEFALTPAA